MTHQIDLSSICSSVTYILWSSDFTACLEDYLLKKSGTWDDRSVSLRDWPCKLYVGQWSIFHGPLILPYIIVIDLKIIYNLEMAPTRGIRDPLGNCSSILKVITKIQLEKDKLWYLTFTTRLANLADSKLVIYFLFFRENRIWYFMQFACNVKSCFLRKIFQNVCWKFYPEC